MKRKIEIFIIFIVIFISDDSLLFGTNMNKIFIVFRYLLYFGILTYLILKFGFKIDKRLLFPLILIFLSIAVTMIINVDFRLGYFVIILVVFLAALISNRIKFRDFTYYYIKIIYALSVISLIVFSIAVSIPSIIQFFPLIQNYGGVEYHSLFICNVINTNTHLKNIGIFREGGVFVIYLLLAIIIELFYNKEINYKRLFVFIIALLSASSTAGYIVLAFLLFVYIVKTNNINIKIGFTILIGLFLIFFLQTLVSNVFAKFDPKTYEYRSTLSRLSSFVIPFMIFIEHLYGIGLSKFGGLYIAYSQKYFGMAFSPSGESTNTIMNTFAIFGLMYGFVLIFGLIKFSRIFNKSKLNMLTVFVALLMMASTQELRFSLLFNLILMYGFINYHPNYDDNNLRTGESYMQLPL